MNFVDMEFRAGYVDPMSFKLTVRDISIQCETAQEAAELIRLLESSKNGQMQAQRSQGKLDFTAAIRATGHDARERAPRRRRLDQVRVGRVVAEVEPALPSVPVAGVLGAAVALEDDRLDRRERAVERIRTARLRRIEVRRRGAGSARAATAAGGGNEGDCKRG